VHCELRNVVGIIGRNGAGKFANPRSAIRNPVTGQEDIYLNGATLVMKRAEIECKFDEIVDLAEVKKFIDITVKAEG
jgi:ABC-type polysaccharide/polyol phosphate transport system ATPase subunit